MFKRAQSKTIGNDAENAAANYLRQAGCNIVAQNVHSRFGEIDLIILDADVLVFVEVKARSSNAFGSPAASVTSQKQQKIIQTAQHFLLSNPQFQQHAMRFDVVAIQLTNQPANNKSLTDSQMPIEWLKDAYRADGF